MQIHKQIEEWYSKWFSGEEELSDEEEEALEELKTIATKSAESERNFYRERYVYDRNRGFYEFVSMLNTVLSWKTDPKLIQVIVEDLIEEFNKVYAPKTPTTQALSKPKE